MFKAFVFIFCAFIGGNYAAKAIKARAYVFRASENWPSGPQESVGVVDFNQNGDTILVNGTIFGLTPGKHGFHVHQFADLSNNCLNAGGHFNPHGKQHGAPTDDDRHVGDLGNIEASGVPATTFQMADKIIALSGENNIIGRAIVIHQGEDDLGRGNQPDSKTTGHAGARYACGVIGIQEESDSSATMPSFALILFLPFINYLRQY
uniref:Superoxide dismutase [Cu-Zn] n=1 Tax=Panagrolaimus sp. JU765 TaxID=591449 RepID=A0AC34Q4K2_9BILA